MEQVSFKDITDRLADILEAKNQAYGNSFDKTMSKWGLSAAGIRLDDKTARIGQLIRSNEMDKNGESLLDNLFDSAGYSVLVIRYIVNKGVATPEQINQYFDDRLKKLSKQE